MVTTRLKAGLTPRKGTFFVLLAILLSGPSYAGLNPLTELTVYRFFSQTSKNSSGVAAYKLTPEGKFAPKQIGNLSVNPGTVLSPGVPRCGVLLNHLQNFSLSVMENVGYLTPEQLKTQSKLIENLDPSQVTFLEMSIPVPTKEVYANPEKYKPEMLSPRPDVERPDHTHVKQAGLWIIAGQSMFPRSHKSFSQEHPESLHADIHWKSELPQAPESRLQEPTTILLTVSAMPWQLDPKLLEPGGMKRGPFGFAEVDRKKFPLVWELGRAAQLEPEHMDTLLRTATTQIHEEVILTYQGRTEDAFVFAKALDNARARRFRKLGFEPVEGACRPGSSCVMVISLTKLLEKFPLGSHSQRVHDLKKMFAPEVPAESILNLLARTHEHFRAELDVHSIKEGWNQETPIIVHDSSKNYVQTLWATTQVMDPTMTPERFQKIRDYLFNVRTDWEPKASQYRDTIPLDPFVDEFWNRNLIRITNLDPQLAARRPSYLPFVLLGVRQQMIQRYEQLFVTNAKEVYQSQEPGLVIQTMEPTTALVAKSLGGQQLQPLRTDNGSLIFTFIFTPQQLDRLETLFPKIKEESRDGVAQGFWFFRRITESPMKF